MSTIGGRTDQRKFSRRGLERRGRLEAHETSIRRKGWQMASGNARDEDKRWEDEIGSINAARTTVATASVVDDDGVARREETGRGKSVYTRERNGMCRRDPRAPSASAMERQQTHACATWSEHSSSWMRGNGTRSRTRRATKWGRGR